MVNPFHGTDIKVSISGVSRHRAGSAYVDSAFFETAQFSIITPVRNPLNKGWEPPEISTANQQCAALFMVSIHGIRFDYLPLFGQEMEQVRHQHAVEFSPSQLLKALLQLSINDFNPAFRRHGSND